MDNNKVVLNNETVSGPYYDWKDLRGYFINLLK